MTPDEKNVSLNTNGIVILMSAGFLALACVITGIIDSPVPFIGLTWGQACALLAWFGLFDTLLFVVLFIIVMTRR
jgi:hypothetical protein